MLQLQSLTLSSSLPVAALCEVILTSFQPLKVRSKTSQSPCHLVICLCHAPLKSTSSSLCSSDLDPLTKCVAWSQLDRSSVLTLEPYKISTRPRDPTFAPHDSRSSRNIGIMIFSPRRRGYQNVPTLLSLPSMCHELCHLQFTKVPKVALLCQSLESFGIMTIAPRSVVTESSSSMPFPNLIPQSLSSSMPFPNLIPQSLSLPLSRSSHRVSRLWKPSQRPNVILIRTIYHITAASANVASDHLELVYGLVLLCSSLQYLWFMIVDLSIFTFVASICYQALLWISLNPCNFATLFV
ncbi:PREDICTED: uncharacterized protein LOC104707856 [Camelina sativa]|uniref:Uncharacterized protein LOC104707856 n=1 Tax=Camelina sativa TaxID=90675 RepID=A0ABM0T8R8_CAMSA|nr:PREDICTED: uncharacterized protein LOC104707856 [Camelina sativa]